MATEQENITETVVKVAAGTARAVVLTMAMASTDNNRKAENSGPTLGRSIMKQLTFKWSSTDKYAELRDFKMEEKNVSKL